MKRCWWQFLHNVAAAHSFGFFWKTSWVLPWGAASDECSLWMSCWIMTSRLGAFVSLPLCPLTAGPNFQNTTVLASKKQFNFCSFYFLLFLSTLIRISEFKKLKWNGFKKLSWSFDVKLAISFPASFFLPVVVVDHLQHSEAASLALFCFTLEGRV